MQAEVAPEGAAGVLAQWKGVGGWLVGGCLAAADEALSAEAAASAEAEAAAAVQLLKLLPESRTVNP